jgi:hypothetical protein
MSEWGLKGRRLPTLTLYGSERGLKRAGGVATV